MDKETVEMISENFKKQAELELTVKRLNAALSVLLKAAKPLSTANTKDSKNLLHYIELAEFYRDLNTDLKEKPKDEVGWNSCGGINGINTNLAGEQ